AELAVGQRRRFFQNPERADHRPREVIGTDAEVVERALGLRAPVAVRGDLDLAHAVGLDACSLAHAPLYIRLSGGLHAGPDFARELARVRPRRPACAGSRASSTCGATGCQPPAS